MHPVPTGFHLAAFAPDGAMEGIGEWEFAKLSGKWLDVCDQFLAANGDLFDVLWGGPLAHIRTKMTSTSGVALVTFSARDKIVNSMALASGTSPAAEESVLGMFVDSLRKVDIVVAAGTPEPFAKVASLSQRPLAIVVPWGTPEVSEQDQTLVRELSVHLAAAFFRRSRS